MSLSSLSGIVPGLDKFVTVDDPSVGITPDETEAMLCGNVAEKIKNDLVRILRELTKRSLEDFLASVQDNERFIEQILDLMRDISSEAFLDKMEEALGPTLTSNYTFAMKVGMRTVRLYAEVIPQILQLIKSGMLDNLEPHKKDFRQFLILIDRCLSHVPPGDVLPDPIEDKRFCDKDMAQIALTFNRSALLILVLLVAHAVRFNIPLSSERIEHIEELLRNWAQEVMTQEAMLLRDDKWTNFEIQPRRSFTGDGEVS